MKNSIVLVRGSTAFGPISKAYLNMPLDEATKRFTEAGYRYSQSSIVEFDEEFNVEVDAFGLVDFVQAGE